MHVPLAALWRFPTAATANRILYERHFRKVELVRRMLATASVVP
jgi:hypothetical protein